MKIDGKTQRIRYYGVDTPERGDRCFREATDRNEHLVGSSRAAAAATPVTRTATSVCCATSSCRTATSVDATLVAEGFGHAWRQDGHYKGEILRSKTRRARPDRGCLWK